MLTRVDEADDAVVDLGAKRGRGARSSGFKKPCGRVSGDFARGADRSQLWPANDLINSGARRDARRGTETATSSIAAPTPRRATGTDITICSAATEVRSDVILFTIASALAWAVGRWVDYHHFTARHWRSAGTLRTQSEDGPEFILATICMDTACSLMLARGKP